MENNFSKVQNRIKLDVGGKHFSVSKETLTSIPNTYFTEMLSSDKSKPCEDGAYFIERNPKVFLRIFEKGTRI